MTEALVTDVLVTDVEVDGRVGMSVWIHDGVVREVAPTPSLADPGPRAARIPGGGGALLPGLHDHHVHLFALAAHVRSVWCGAPDVTDPASLVGRLALAASRDPGGGWIRAVGWDDSVAGWPDRRTLDLAVDDRPIRLKHRSGAMWVLNSAGLALLGLDEGTPVPSGVEVGEAGHLTGRIAGLDDWLREQIGGELPSLRDVSADLSRRGVTGVTDATAENGPDELAALATARRAGELDQRLVAMTADPDVAYPAELGRGPVKISLFDPDLPGLDAFIGQVRAAHDAGRAVAIHAASRVTVVMATAALEEAGVADGDRVEHASVVPPESLAALADLGITVVTQPHFIAENGDRYRADVDPPDQPWLYRARSFLDAGIPYAAGSDAPVGGHDPWAIMAAAVQRRTLSGEVMAPEERLTPEEALALFLGTPEHPGGTPRMVRPGEPADLCLLDRPWSEARTDLSQVGVRATIVGGRVVHDDRQA